jgi:hypothetical protein
MIETNQFLILKIELCKKKSLGEMVNLRCELKIVNFQPRKYLILDVEDTVVTFG